MGTFCEREQNELDVQLVRPRVSNSLRRLSSRPPKRAFEFNGMCILGNGAQGRDRTTDTAIFSRMLYQLSYLGAPFRLAAGCIGRVSFPVQLVPGRCRARPRPGPRRSARDSLPSASGRDRCWRNASSRTAGSPSRRAFRMSDSWRLCARRAAVGWRIGQSSPF
jgi:hypothetical protein